MNNKPENQGRTWFWKWFLDNQLVTGLLILLLLLVNLILFSQTSYLLNPIKGFISAIGVPVACGAVIYYLVKPIYDFLVSKKSAKRNCNFSSNARCCVSVCNDRDKLSSDYSKAIIRLSFSTALLLSNY